MLNFQNSIFIDKLWWVSTKYTTYVIYFSIFLTKNEFILSIIGYIICIIASLFYNELIICNFCGLSENTTDNIRRRGQEDQKDSLIKIDESENDHGLNTEMY